MKKLLLMLLISSGMYAQQIFNVQHYCIDEKPLKQGSCDISGNEYSFVFLDSQKKEVTLYLTDVKLAYTIIAVKTDSGTVVYTLKNDAGTVEMRINSAKTKIEFLGQERNIVLTVGKSTKAT